MTRAMLAFAIALAACGGPQQPPGDPTPTPPPAKDTRTAFEQRRDKACANIAPKLTQCAADDAKADLDAGKVTPAQYKQDTSPDVLRKNTEEFVEKCESWRDMSSRQVRVLEVCDREETQCGPLRNCLEHLQPEHP